MIEPQRGGACVCGGGGGGLTLLSSKEDKWCASQGRTSSQHYMSTSWQGNRSYVWVKNGVCVCLWCNLEKLLRYWTVSDLINVGQSSTLGM